MICQRKMENGAVDKEIVFRLKYTHNFPTGNAIVQHEASLSAMEMTFHDMLSFQKDMQHIFSRIKRLSRTEDYVEMELIIQAYENVPEYKDLNGCSCRLNQILFDHWSYAGNWSELAYENGFKLTPDEKYTEANRDIYICLDAESKGLVEQIAEMPWVFDRIPAYGESIEDNEEEEDDEE